MIATQSEIRGRIEQLRLSYEGYKRQLARANFSSERQGRLEMEVRLIEEEITTLEKMVQMGRVEPDRAKIKVAVQERLDTLRGHISLDPSWADLPVEQQEFTSGEIKALLWALGEDSMTHNVQLLIEGHEHADPSRTDRAVPNILVHMLESGPNVEARASAAYELGKLRIAQAIPALAVALHDDSLVAGMALQALCAFSEEELGQAGLEDAALEAVRSARDTQGFV